MQLAASRRRATLRLGLSFLLTTLLTPLAAQDDSRLARLAERYASEVKPLLARYCTRCHSGDEPEAEIDLESFATLEEVRAATRTWQKVREMVDSGQMPPRRSKQPADAERELLATWVREYLTAEAASRAGDPGEVILRRLSNSEYTYSVRDLTGVASLDPAHEFPVDGAAGEGFTNTGAALVMSPTLVTKYLDAAKEISRHAALLPEGIEFSEAATRRDRTDEWLARIRRFYRRYTDGGDGSLASVTPQSERLPLERYLAATLVERQALERGDKTIDTTIDSVASERGLSARYLQTLWRTLAVSADTTPSIVLDRIRERWRDASSGEAEAVHREIERWQDALWKFNTVGHVGRQGGPQSWMEAVDPIAERREFRVKLPEKARDEKIAVYLAAGDAGDGNDQDHVVWRNPRLEGGGQPPLSLRHVAGLARRLTEVKRERLGEIAEYLDVLRDVGDDTDIVDLAARHGLDPEFLRAWLRYLDREPPGPVEVAGHFEQKLHTGGNYDFIQGWGSPTTPSIVANSSDQQVRIPGIAPPRSVVGHPSPTVFAAVGWKSPIDGEVRVEARITDRHPECGNGAEWLVEHRTSHGRFVLGRGDFERGGSAKLPPQTMQVLQGSLISLILGPRNGNHTCDLTQLDLVITETSGDRRTWNLAADVSPDILAGNPHADRHGNADVWHLYRGEMASLDAADESRESVPEGSLLARWQTESDRAKRVELAQRIEELALGEAPAEETSPDALLRRKLHDLATPGDIGARLDDITTADERFGKHPLGHDVAASNLVVRAPATTEFRLPASLAAGRELVVTAELDPEHGEEGSVQVAVGLERPDDEALARSLPVIARHGSVARRRVQNTFDAFRAIFPASVCYARIVPVDEVVTLTLFYREDVHLKRLLLDEAEVRELDRLWDELRFVSREPLLLVTAYEQITEFATQDRPDLVEAFKPLRQPILERAGAFRKRLARTEPVHIDAVLELADRAWRRPLTDGEKQDLRELYQELRASGIEHDPATRLLVARVLTSPAFLYKIEQPAPGTRTEPIAGTELATRLSYFLWSSLPDAELRRVADAGTLLEPQTLVEQARRMLRDARTRRLAVEFACQWLHIRDFDRRDDKNEKLYPRFTALRDDMYEESVRFFEDLFRNDGSVLDLLDADHGFLNGALARHYGIDGVTGDGWKRVDNLRAWGRGGILGMATVLASQSGASRTSPILRGNWVYETLLGERLPRPPPGVPQLPDEVPGGLTARELIEKHSSVPECSRCHARIDPYGFALEQYDAIGRLRPEPVNTRSTLPDGRTIEGIDGLRRYLLEDRRDDVLRQFCRKLLGYALGREVQLSDEPLLAEMMRRLEARGHRFSAAVEAITTSPQFRQARGRDVAGEE